MALNKKQIQEFKARAHALKPVVLLGNNGLTPAVLNEIEQALEYHELIKVKIPSEDRDERREVIAQICESTKAELIQTLGQVATLYRKRVERK